MKFRLCRAAFFYDYDYFRKWVWILRSDYMYATHIYKEHLFWILVENVGSNVKHIRFSTRIISVKILKSHLTLDYFKLRKIVFAMFSLFGGFFREGCSCILSCLKWDRHQGENKNRQKHVVLWSCDALWSILKRILNGSDCWIEYVLIELRN